MSSLFFPKRTYRKFRFSRIFFAIIFLTLLLSGCNSNKKQTKTFKAMDTYMTISAWGKNAKKANKQIYKSILELEEKISVTKTESEIYNLNNARGNSVPVSPDTRFLLEYSKEFYIKSEKNFNPAIYPIIKEWGFTQNNYHIPEAETIHELLANTDLNLMEINESSVKVPSGMQIDLGAIGKGYASDLAKKIYSELKVKNALIDLGGNIMTIGTKTNNKLWNIGIKNPFTGVPFAAVKAADTCVITSGGYERYFAGPDQKKYIHIYDPSTGCPVQNNIASVTIINKNGLYGDALSTSLFVMGEKKAVEFWKKYRNFDFVILFDNQEVWYSEGLSEKIKFYDNVESTKIIYYDK